jgi:hypothetical protein
MTGIAQLSWWLVGNRHGGLHRVRAESAVEARHHAREGIAEAFLAEGMSGAAAARGASSYRVRVFAGGCTEAEALAAVLAWDDFDHSPAVRLHRRWCLDNHHRPFV